MAASDFAPHLCCEHAYRSTWLYVDLGSGQLVYSEPFTAFSTPPITLKLILVGLRCCPVRKRINVHDVHGIAGPAYGGCAGAAGWPSLPQQRWCFPW